VTQNTHPFKASPTDAEEAAAAGRFVPDKGDISLESGCLVDCFLIGGVTGAVSAGLVGVGCLAGVTSFVGVAIFAGGNDFGGVAGLAIDLGGVTSLAIDFGGVVDGDAAEETR